MTFEMMRFLEDGQKDGETGGTRQTGEGWAISLWVSSSSKSVSWILCPLFRFVSFRFFSVSLGICILGLLFCIACFHFDSLKPGA